MSTSPFVVRGINVSALLMPMLHSRPIITLVALWVVHSIISRCVIQSHTCAVLVGGAVRCWGYNEYGQVMLLELFGESSMCVQPFRFDLTL
jgi:hypothetical protein